MSETRASLTSENTALRKLLAWSVQCNVLEHVCALCPRFRGDAKNPSEWGCGLDNVATMVLGEIGEGDQAD